MVEEDHGCDFSGAGGGECFYQFFYADAAEADYGSGYQQVAPICASQCYNYTACDNDWF